MKNARAGRVSQEQLRLVLRQQGKTREAERRRTELAMATRPKLPLGEAPLDAASVERLLANLGADMVLVGGQALAFWMSRFDIDAEGRHLQRRRCAGLGRARNAARRVASGASRTARAYQPHGHRCQLRLPARAAACPTSTCCTSSTPSPARAKSAEFTRRVISNSIEVEWQSGRVIRVMEPFDVLESRAQNAVGLFEDKGPHVVTQARWAVLVAREALLRLAQDSASTDRLGTKLQRVCTLARSQVGKRLLAERGVELLEAVDGDTLLPLAPPRPPTCGDQAILAQRRA